MLTVSARTDILTGKALYATSVCADCSCTDVVSSRGVSEVVYPTVDKNATKPVSMTPLYKTLQSYVASMKLSSKRFAF